jgi:hypothetical protein
MCTTKFYIIDLFIIENADVRDLKSLSIIALEYGNSSDTEDMEVDMEMDSKQMTNESTDQNSKSENINQNNVATVQTLDLQQYRTTVIEISSEESDSDSDSSISSSSSSSSDSSSGSSSSSSNNNENILNSSLRRYFYI